MRRAIVYIGAVVAVGVAVFIVINSGKTANLTFSSSNIDAALHTPFYIVAGDADGDTAIDLAVGDPGSNNLYAYVSNGGSTYSKYTVASSVDVQGLDIGDIDGDLDLDLVIGDYVGDQYVWYENNEGAPSTWPAHAVKTSVDKAIGVALADVDGDENVDVVTTGNGQVVWYQNDGTPDVGEWSSTVVASLAGVQMIEPGDFDNDGDTDFVATGPSSGSLLVIEDTGSALSAVTAVSGESGIYPVNAGDVDGDGYDDVVYGYTGGTTDTIVWLESDGDPGNAASWASHSIASTFGDGTAIQVVDIDNDGDNDVVGSTKEEDQITMYDNTAGDGSAWTERNLASTTDPAFLETADLDGDGDDDLLYTISETFIRGLNTNIVPELVSTSIINLDDTNNIYANRKAYNFQAVVQDNNGTADIDQVKIRTTIGATSYILNWDNDGPTCTTSTNPALGGAARFSISGDCTTSAVGNELTVTFPVIFDWAIGDTTDADLQAYVKDETGSIAGWTTLQTDYFDIETDVNVDSGQWAFHDDTVNPEATASINYRVDYEGSNYPVPDSQIVSVTAMLDKAGGDEDITLTPGTTGAGTVTITVPSTTGLYTVSPYVELAGTGGTVDGDARNTSFTVDRVIVSGIQISGHKYQDASDRYWEDNDDSDDEMTVIVGLKSERTNTAITPGTVSLGDETDGDRYGSSSISASGAAVFVVEEDPSAGVIITRDNLELSNAVGNDFGTDVNNGSLNTMDIGWDNAPPLIDFSDVESEILSGSYTVEPEITDDTVLTEVLLDVFTKNEGDPTTEQESIEGEDEDGVYYYRAQATDSLSNVSSVTGKKVVVDRENEAPNRVSEGFDPADGATAESSSPTLSWTKTSDPDATEAAADLIYHVYLDKDGELKQSYAYDYTTNAGETSVDVSAKLSVGTWYWAVTAEDPRGGVSKLSNVQSFEVAGKVTTGIDVTLTVGVNADQSSGNSEVSGWILPFVPAVMAATSSSPAANQVVSVLGGRFIVSSDDTSIAALNTVSHPGVNYAVIGFIVLGVGYALGALRQRKPFQVTNPVVFIRSSVRHLWALLIFFFTRPSHSFGMVVPRNGSGTWMYSFSTYQKHQKISRAAAGTGVALLAAKLMVIVAISIFLINTAHRVVGSSPYLDDNREVAPDDVLTYRVDFENSSDANASSLVFTAPIPSGTTYLAGSSLFDGTPATDASDGDAVTLSDDGQSLVVTVDEIEVAATSYFEYQVQITEPSAETSIANSVSYVASSFPKATTNETTNVLTPGTIGGIVWDDENQDAAKDRLEAGLQDVTLRLYKDENGNNALDLTADTLVSALDSAQNGSYDFTGLGFGAYFVDVDHTDVASGYELTTTRDPITVTTLRGADVNDINFGFYAAPSEEEETTEETPDEEAAEEDESSEEVAIVDDGTDEEARKTITIRDLEVAVPPGEEEILEGFEFLTFGTPSDRRLLESSSGFNITVREDVLLFEGRAKPKSTVKLTVFSDPYSVTTSVEEDGVWAVQIPISIIGDGEHRVVAQVTDPEGRTSSDIEIARIVIEREELSQINIIIYGVLVLIIIVLTVLVVHYVYKRRGDDNDDNIPRVPPGFRGFDTP